MPYLSFPRPPEHHVSTRKHFPRPALSPEQSEARSRLRAKAPQRRPVRKRRFQAEAAPSPLRTVFGFAAGFALSLPVATFLIAPWAVRGAAVPSLCLAVAAVGGLLGAAFFARD